MKAVSQQEQIQPHLWWACAGCQVLPPTRASLQLQSNVLGQAFISFLLPPVNLIILLFTPSSVRKESPSLPLCASNLPLGGSENCFCFSVMLWRKKNNFSLSMCTLVLGLTSGGENTLLSWYVYTSIPTYLGKICYCFVNACNAIKAFFFFCMECNNADINRLYSNINGGGDCAALVT